MTQYGGFSFVIGIGALFTIIAFLLGFLMACVYKKFMGISPLFSAILEFTPFPTILGPLGVGHAYNGKVRRGMVLAIAFFFYRFIALLIAVAIHHYTGSSSLLILILGILLIVPSAGSAYWAYKDAQEILRKGNSSRVP
jgi:hypothetical protein